MQLLELIKAKNWAEISRLIERGAFDPNLEFRDERTETKYRLLPLVIGDGGTDLAIQLISRGADLNQFQEGCTPLMIACERRDRDVIEALLTAGANVNLRAGEGEDGGGETALVMAAEAGDLWATKRLLKAGADVRIITDQNETALYWAVQSRNRDVIAALVAAECPFLGNELHWPVFKRDAEIVKCLLDYGCNPNTSFGRDDDDGLLKGDTPLIAAVRTSPIEKSRYDKGAKSRLEMTKLLLAGGANTNVANAKGNSPLHYAVQQREVELAKLLLAAGAAPDFRPLEAGPEALSPSAMANENKMYEFMRLFKAKRKS